MFLKDFLQKKGEEEKREKRERERKEEMEDEWDDAEIEEALAYEAEAQRVSSAVHVGKALEDEEAEEAAMLAAAEAVEARIRAGTSAAAEVKVNSGAPKCQVCGSMSVDQTMLSVYKEPVCVKCKSENAGFKTVTKGKAKEEFLVTDDDLLYLKYQEVSNPRRVGWTRMKLYLVKQVERLSMKRWEDKEKLEQEKARRQKERFRKKEQKAREMIKGSKKSNTDSVLKRSIAQLHNDLGEESKSDTKKRESNQEEEEEEEDDDDDERTSRKKKKKGKKDKKKKRKKERLAETKKPQGGAVKAFHKHVYGPAKLIDASKDLYRVICTECGYEMDYEEL